jgi:hypothetical protein
MMTREVAAAVEDDENLTLAHEWGFPVIAVGYFAADDSDVVCVHRLDDLIGARMCAKALREER